MSQSRPAPIHLPRDPQRATAPQEIRFIGNATCLINLYGFTVLTDPNFLHRGEQVHLGYGVHSTRRTDPAMELDELPPLDFVLLSHLHEDHFDREVEARLDRSTRIVTTPAGARALRQRGFDEAMSMRTWDQFGFEQAGATLTVTALPGRHGPPGLARLLPPVMGSLLEFTSADGSSTLRIYISGDTLMFDELREIPRRFPGVDIALLHLGGTRIFGVLLTMDGRQGLELVRLIDADVSIPIHYDDYEAFKSPLEDFQRAVESAGWADRVRYLGRGDRYRIERLPSHQ